MANIDYFNKIEKLINKTPKPIYVGFAIYCAKDSLQYIKDENIKAQVSDAIDIVDRYNKGLASEKELSDAYSAAYTVYSAVNAVNAAYTAYTVYSAVYSAVNAVNAANTASAANTTKEDKMKEYYEKLLMMLKEMTHLEKIIYGVET